MEPVLADVSATISELKKSPAALLRQTDGWPVVILENNKPFAYLIATKRHEELMEAVEGYDEMMEALDDSEKLREAGDNSEKLRETLEYYDQLREIAADIDPVPADMSASVSELRKDLDNPASANVIKSPANASESGKDPAALLRKSGGRSVVILDDNKPFAYLIAAKKYEKFGEAVECYEDYVWAFVAKQRLEDEGSEFIEVSIDDL